MKLYELTEEFKALEAMAEGIDNADDADAFATLWDEINQAFETKAENTAKVIRNLDLQVEAFKLEESRLKARRQAMENNAQRLRDYLEDHMKANGIDKIKGQLFSLSIQKNPASLKTDEEVLGDWWCTFVRKPDNAKIKEALKNGREVKGAWLEQSESLRIK